MQKLKFHKRFADLILTGAKTTTIRTSIKRGTFIITVGQQQLKQCDLEFIRELSWPDLSTADKLQLVRDEDLESIEDLERALRECYWYAIDDILSGERKLYLHRIINVRPLPAKLFAD